MRYIYYLIILVLLASCSKDDDGSDIKRKTLYKALKSNFSEQPNDAILLSSDQILTVVTSTENNGLKLMVLSSDSGQVLESKLILDQSQLFARSLLKAQNSFYITSDYERSQNQRNIRCIEANNNLTVVSEFNIPSQHHEVGVKMIKQNTGVNHVLLANRKNKNTDTWGFVLYETNGLGVLNEFDFPHKTLQSGSDIIKKRDGSGYYVFAHVIEDISKSTDFVLFELDNALSVVTKKYFGGKGYEEARKIVEDDNGQVYLFGHSASQDILHQIYLVKLDENLNLIYENHYGSPYHDGGQTLCFDGNSQLTLVGRTDAPLGSEENIYVIKLNVNGSVIDEYYLGGELPNRSDIVLNDNGVDYIIGYKIIDNDFTKNIEFYKINY